MPVFSCYVLRRGGEGVIGNLKKRMDGRGGTNDGIFISTEMQKRKLRQKGDRKGRKWSKELQEAWDKSGRK